MAHNTNILSFNPATGSLLITLDNLLTKNDAIGKSYKEHGHFGFSYERYGQTVAREIGLLNFLKENIGDPTTVHDVQIAVGLPNVSFSTSFLHGLLDSVKRFSKYSNWQDKLTVKVREPYQNATSLAVAEFLLSENHNLLDTENLEEYA